MWAADQGNTEIAVALVEKGAAMDVQDKNVRWRGDCYVTFVTNNPNYPNLVRRVYVHIVRVDGF